MSRRWAPIMLVAAVLCAAPAPARAGWMWSPQTGWISGTGSAKDSPEEQLDFAMVFFERKDWDRAKSEFKKLVRAYKHSPQAAEGQYCLGRVEEARGDYYEAFKAYRKTIQVYPSTKRFEEILEREYQLGNYFLSGKKRKFLGTAAIIPARDKAVEVFEAIAEDGPFSEYGQLAQYKLGLTHLALHDYEHAVTAFEKVIEQYPDSPLVDDARFQIAVASLKGTFRAGYDQAPTDRAIKELSAFVKTYDGSDLRTEADDKLDELNDRRAQHEFGVAQFYERRKQPGSAIVYYQAIIDKYPQTSWAAKASARLDALALPPEPSSEARQGSPDAAGGGNAAPETTVQ